MKLKYLVTGTGRSGTVYMARLLSSIGIPCGHESIFTNQGLAEALNRLEGWSKADLSECAKEKCPDWKIDVNEIKAESSYMAAPYLEHPCLSKAKIIHVVRNPVEVINSFVFGFGYFKSAYPIWDIGRFGLIEDDFHKFIYRHVPELGKEMHSLTRACIYYVKWNEMIEKMLKDRDHLFFRLEDDLSYLFDYLEVNPDDYYKDQKANSSNKESKYGTVREIPDTPEKKIFLEMMDRYGYGHQEKLL